MPESHLEEATDARIVIEYDEIADDKEAQFRQWQSQLRDGVSQFKGYLKTDICPPIKGVQDKWYIVVHFNSPASLGEWLDSDIRHYLVGLGKKQFGAYRYKIGTGLERWFSKRKSVAIQQEVPPAWKQNFAVLFGLYPTVMIETALFDRFQLMADWSFASKMFVSNLISCSLLTWVVMPLTTRLLNFWLNPVVQRSTALTRSPNTSRSDGLRGIDLIGTLLIFLGYGFMIALFQALS